MREQRGRGLGCSPIHVSEELLVDFSTNHCGEFFGHGVNDSRFANERRRILGAPPMKFFAPGAPVAPVPLGDARDDPSTVLDLVVTT